MGNLIDSSIQKDTTCSARSSCYTFEPPGSETGLCLSLSSHLSLRQESFSACECLREGL